jgi:arylsulfatase A-like enzyme
VYTACPARELGRSALVTGRFPHSTGDPAVEITAAVTGVAAAAEFFAKKRADGFLLIVDSGTPASPEHRYDPAVLRPRQNVPVATEDRVRQELARYYDSCSAIAEDFGRLLAVAPADSTVVFTSDRGVQLGSQGIEGDDAPFEESIRVPLAIRYPHGHMAGTASGALISEADLLPGLIENGEPPAHSESVYCEGALGKKDEWRVVVRGYDKLIFTPAGQATHLFNLADDPYEMTNLVNEPGAKLTRASMTALAQVWMKKLADRRDPSGLKRRK